MTAADPTFYTGITLDPATWPGRGFDLYQGDTWLAALPPSVGFTGNLGTEDPYTYSRPPGGGNGDWFKRGTGQPRERPLLTLGGTWTYRTEAEARAHAAQIEAALLTADRLTLQGQLVTPLRTDFPQIVQTTSGARYVEIRYALTLQPGEPVTRTGLALGDDVLNPGALWSLTVQPLARSSSGAFLRGAVVLGGATRTLYDPQSGNVGWRFGTPILLAPLAGLLASHAEQSRTRGGAAHVVADPGVGLCSVSYHLVTPDGAALAGLTVGVLTLGSVLTTTAQVTQTLTLLRCEALHLRDGTLVTP